MKRWIALLVIIAAGLILRWHDLGRESLWLDEGIMVRVAHMAPIEIIKNSMADNHPPLYPIILHFWIALFGDSERSSRSLSVLCGVLFVLASSLLTRRLFDRAAGLTVATITAVSAYYVTNAQEVKMYSLALLLAIVSMYYFLEFLMNRKRSTAALYICFTALLLYTHYSGIFIPLVQGLFCLILAMGGKKRAPVSLKGYLMMQSLAFLLFLPWISTSFAHFIRAATNPASGAQVAFTFDILKPFISYASSPQILPLMMILAVSPIFSSTGEAVTGDALTRGQKNTLLFIWLLVPIAILVALSRAHIVYYASRYTAIASPALFILSARGISGLRRNVRAAAFTTLVAVSLLVTLLSYEKGIKDQWREATRFIESRARAGELLIFHEGYFLENIFDYYRTRKDLTAISFSEESARIPLTLREKFAPVTKAEIDRIWPIANKYDKIWLILSYTRDPKKLISRMFNREYGMALYQHFRGIDIYLLKRRSR